MSDQGSNAGTPPPPQETKPKADGDNTLNIKVVSTDGNEVFFKIKRTTKLNKLKSAYADRVGKNVSSIRFIFDGERVNDDDTPESMDMNEGDSLEVVLEQIGGY